MLPPELVKLIIGHAWRCLSTSSHQHALSMTGWMLVSHDWLKIVLSVVFRDMWITSDPHFRYLLHLCTYHPFQPSPIRDLAGITNIKHLTRTCRSLTIFVHHKFQHHYVDECMQLIEHATTDSPHMPSHPKASPASLATHELLPHSTLSSSTVLRPIANETPSLVELHVTFAYTTPPPVLLMDAPRGTFFPPPSRSALPRRCYFHGVQRLVVRGANADFVAFLTTVCPRLQKAESTAEFSREDVPEMVPADVRDRLEFVTLPWNNLMVQPRLL
ncbi:hypothetical protein MSAN_00551700 [Mycena sanguinolenta]|uniref:Uncharacterized protein n=1 Tax=Mycena sanguinolenta TaxID=230812 RepID=A0A8H7DJB6_9AGAR|nr:hypothetical protein MSAN_00551700 [Mycena sanguinolenta]